ncbi:MAG: cytochrome c oxidase assembly protein [Woeseia sp.]|nr:cytochrome c oxidase assembly protein [Woeseia sp.]|tara:strand:- start:11 stop:628 length:618 start_codon:yes stop_codon:yes gene_type:complete
MDRATKFLAISFLVIAFTSGFLFLYKGLQHKFIEPEHATILPSAMDLPSFSLTDHNSLPFTRDELLGSWHLVFFGFTHCPDICPATLSQLAIARSQLAEKGYKTPKILLISVDPERDTPDKLKNYLSYFDSSISGLTGSPEKIFKLTKTLGIFFSKSYDQNGDYSVDHSAAILLIGPDAKWHALFQAPHKIEHFVTDIPRLTSKG